MKDNNCAYCVQGDLLDKFGYPVGQMESGYLKSRQRWAE